MRKRGPLRSAFGPIGLALVLGSCGALADYAVEKKVDTKSEGESTNEANRLVVEIQTGGHSHFFPKSFMRYVKKLESTDAKDWEEAGQYFSGYPTVQATPEGRQLLAAARYGAFLSQTLITVRSLNELNTFILGLLGDASGKPKAPALVIGLGPGVGSGWHEVPARHGRGDALHSSVEALLRSTLLDPVDFGIGNLDTVLEENDFIFPIEKVTLGIDLGELKAEATFRGYHNKVAAHGLKQALRFFGMLGEFLTSIREPTQLLATLVSAPDLSGLTGPLFVGKGGRTFATLLNSDSALLRFYSEHVGRVKAYFIPWITEGSAFEPYLRGKDDTESHYTEAFVIVKGSDGRFALRVDSVQTKDSGGRLALGLPNEYETLTPEGRTVLDRHLADTNTPSMIPASLLLRGALSNTSFVFNKILSEVVVSSLLAGTSLSAPSSSSVQSFMDSLNSVLETVGGIHLGIDKELFYVNVHRLFEVIADLRDVWPAWSRASGNTPAHFFVEFECGEMEPTTNLSKLDSSGVKCKPSEDTVDAAHFAGIEASRLAGEGRKAGGISLEDPRAQSLWSSGAPKDGKRSPYVHLLWQDPAFGGAVQVDPAALNWKKYGVALEGGATIPCGVMSEVQGLSGPGGVCLLNLLADVLGSAN